MQPVFAYLFFFFFQAEDGIRDLTVTGVQTCALPISCASQSWQVQPSGRYSLRPALQAITAFLTSHRKMAACWPRDSCQFRSRSSKTQDRKSTRLNSSHSQISYAVFCLKKKNKTLISPNTEIMCGAYYLKMQKVNAICMKQELPNFMSAEVAILSLHQLHYDSPVHVRHC